MRNTPHPEARCWSTARIRRGNCKRLQTNGFGAQKEIQVELTGPDDHSTLLTLLVIPPFYDMLWSVRDYLLRRIRGR